MDDLIREMYGDIKVIKGQVSDMKLSHDEFSKRMVPVEDDYKLRMKVYRFILGGGLVGLVSLLMTIFLRK